MSKYNLAGMRDEESSKNNFFHDPTRLDIDSEITVPNIGRYVRVCVIRRS